MNDQATRLRGMMESQGAAAAVAEPPHDDQAQRPAARVIAVTSGKGGVGKTNLALNLAIVLQRMKLRVCLVDANPGLSNVDLLCGLNGYWNLSHVVTGARSLPEIVLVGPEDVHLVTGAGALADLADGSIDVRDDVLRQLEHLETDHDYLVVDTGAGMHRSVRNLVEASDVALVVTTPEPTAIADAYATVKSLSVSPPGSVMAVVNQAESASQAKQVLDRMRHTAGLFLHTDIVSGGSIPNDHHVPAAVARRSPLVEYAPRSPAAEAIQRLARRVKSAADGCPTCGGFFRRLPEPHDHAA
ncbi:MAG: P-loop NTPase [Planctomycetaceae bacterium]